MNNEANNQASEMNQGTNPLLMIGIIVAVVVVGAGVFFMNKNAAPTAEEKSITAQVSPTPTSAVVDTKASDSGVITGNEVQTIAVEGGMFYFKPNEIRVKKGATVKIVFTNKEGMHDFTLDEFKVKTKQTKTGQSAEVTFTADKVGTFEFYCSVGNHRAQGMKGNLIVE